MVWVVCWSLVGSPWMCTKPLPFEEARALFQSLPMNDGKHVASLWNAKDAENAAYLLELHQERLAS